ncbi:hypothetical protein OESDEN_14593 [Oesophagostomum dentatum]|uniref:Uncharacterized protein n=1 Tax=Oesophagostomum dentatum TaxID=61180 RepID=A0A0B1SR79_OESDE|nr:hypothetical protein OESDEN_14593 [Oesophagostomum dentatum]
MSVNALKIAIKHLKETRYWTGNEQNSTDRATSILMWEKNKHVDAMLMLELSLPHPFDPTAGTGVPREYPRFVHDDGEKSIPYISSGGVMLTLTKDGETRAIMAASASGSEGAVQGVADAILMMLYHKTAGGAAELKHVYLDLSDGRGNEEFIYWYGTECDSVEENLIEGYVPERKVMAVTVDEDYYDYTSMAMTQEDDDYNYAVGF